MRSKFSTGDIENLAILSRLKLRKMGYKVETEINSVGGRYGCVYYFNNGKIYTTGLDSKDDCARKIKALNDNLEDLVVKYCVSDNL